MPPKVDKLQMSREHKRSAKLSDAQVKKVYDLYAKGYTQKAIAEKFGVCQSTICFIVNDRARENLRAHQRRNPPKKRTTEEMTSYMRELRARKTNLLLNLNC